MLEVPVIVFYLGTFAMVLVSTFLIAFLFYLIKAARIIIGIAEFIEQESRKVSGKLEDLRRMARFFAGFFHK